MFICTPRLSTDAELGSNFQITDLFPHKTQSNATVTPRFQGPQYIYAPVISNSLPVIDADFDLVGEQSGLALYFLACIENQGNGEAPTPAEAKDIADAVIARMESGLTLTKTDIDFIIEDVLGNGLVGNALDAGASEGSVAEVLAILSGYSIFTLPSGQSIAGALNLFEGLGADSPADFISAPTYADRLITEMSSTMAVSARRGQLSKATKGDEPLVVIYNNDGSLFE